MGGVAIRAVGMRHRGRGGLEAIRRLPCPVPHWLMALHFLASRFGASAPLGEREGEGILVKEYLSILIPSSSMYTLTLGAGHG
jgi:hypothetical protein